MQATHRRSSQRGLSLIEAVVVLAVVALSLGAALPSFESVRARRHLEGAAAQLETELQYARSSAVALDRTVRVSFEDGPLGSCYIIHTGSSQDCRCSGNGTASCVPGAQMLRAASFDTASPVQVTSNSRSIAYSSDFGTVTPTGTVALRNRRNEAVHLVVNLMGRVRSCAATPGITGLPRC